MPSDHDLLIRLDERTSAIAKSLQEIAESIKDYPVTRQALKNHLSSHRRNTGIIISVATAAATVIVAIIERILNGVR